MLNHKLQIKDAQVHEDELCIHPANKQRTKGETIQTAKKPKCTECGFTGQMVIEERHGCASISWIACLTAFTGILFWIPLLKGCCRDKVTLCPQCCHEISTEYAECF